MAKINSLLKKIIFILQFSCTYYIAVGTYIPRKEVVVDETIRATVIKPNQAIKLRARKETLVSKLKAYICMLKLCFQLVLNISTVLLTNYQIFFYQKHKAQFQRVRSQRIGGQMLYAYVFTYLT